MKKKIALLLFMAVVLGGCGKSGNSIVKYKQIETMTTVNKEGNEVEIRTGDTLGDILEKLQAPYQDSFEKVEKAEITNYKVNGQKVTIEIENYMIGHYTVDCIYGLEVRYKTEKEDLSFCFNSSFSNEDLRKLKLEDIMVE